MEANKRKKVESRLKSQIKWAVQANSVLSDRAGYTARLGKQFDNNRELYDILGYKEELEFNDYLSKYMRQNIAKRIVDMPAQTTWRNAPALVEEKDKQEETEFEKAWTALNKRLRALHYMEKADRLAGIGRYGVLLIGFANSGKLDTPITEVSGPEDIIYLKAYTEGTATIEEYETDTASPRFGKPLYYTIDLAGDLASSPENRNAASKMGAKLSNLKQTKVHYSRVLHIAEDTLEDELFGTPRLRPIYNLLDDLEKVEGGSAEMFWQGAYRGLHIDVDPDATLGQLGDDEITELADEIDEYVHGLRRFIRTQGATVKPIDVELGDPSPTFKNIISLIAGTSGIPQRILIGSERGEQASTQDEQNWAAYIRDRRDQYAEPMIFRAFVDRLVELRALPDTGGYEINWPPIGQLTKLQEAQMAESYSRAIRFASGNKATKDELIVTPQEFRSQYLGLPPEPQDQNKDIEKTQTPEDDGVQKQDPEAERTEGEAASQ